MFSHKIKHENDERSVGKTHIWYCNDLSLYSSDWVLLYYTAMPSQLIILYKHPVRSTCIFQAGL